MTERRVLRSAGFVPVEAKFVPSVRRDGLVLRGQLVDGLLESADAPVVLVTGPPGAGKTALVSQWADEDVRPFAWLLLDDGDNDPTVLVTYVLLALHRVEAVDAAMLAPSTRRGESRTKDALDHLRRTLRSRQQPFVLVLDNAHVLTSRGALDVLKTLVRLVPQRSQLVVVGRTAPALDWGALRATHRLAEVSGHDLRFTPVDAQALIIASGAAVTGQQVDEILERTEGWAAGLYLATLPITGAVGRTADAADSHGMVAGFLRDELLANLSQDDQEFLLRTSILSRLTGRLCDAVLLTKNSHDTLRRLEQSNILIQRVDKEGRWFRLHGQFADALRAELQRREPELLRVLHGRASRWLEANDEPAEAVAHAIAAADVDHAARLIWDQAAGCLARGQLATLEQWLAEFTPQQVVGHAKLALTAAWCALCRGRPADHWVVAAEQGHYEAGRKGEAASVASAAALLRATLARHGVVQMAADAQLAVTVHDVDDSWRCWANALDAIATWLTGHADEARTMLEDVERHATSVGAHRARALALGELALLAVEDDDEERAQRLATEAAAVMEGNDLEGMSTLLPVHCARALLVVRSGRVEEATTLLRRCLTMLAGALNPPAWQGVQCREVLARAQIMLDDPAAARLLLAEAQELLPTIADATSLSAALDRTWRQLEAIPLDAGRPSASLTTAELRVLQFLPTHLSFEDIGRQLFVSRNTVKTQAVAAYRKLGVSSRSEAVERAMALGLISR